jgi:peptide/nickel transport system substrate-binding protein
MTTTHLRLGALAAALALTSGCFPGGDSDAAASDDRIAIAMLNPPRSGMTPLSDDAFKLSRWSTAETLVQLDAAGLPQPMLATAWERTGEKEWTFTLRDDVTFHDGTPLTSADVVRSLETAADATPVPRILDGVTLDVEAPDERTVVVTTGDVDPLLPNRLSSPQLSILAAAAYDGRVVSPVGTGTGPFELTAIDGTSGATLDRYPDYWGERAQAAGIDVQYVPDGTARAAALRTGDADVVEAVPVGQVAQLDEDLVVEVPMPRTNTLYLNTEKGPFRDPAVRAAAREAVDRARLVADVYERRADEARGLLGPALPWADAFRDDADYTQALAGRAAPAQVDGVRITLGTFTDRAELPEVAVLLEQQLEAAGFVVEQDVREYQFIEADALEGAFDAFILSRATVLDSGDPVAYMASDFGCEGGFNISQLCDRDVDAALERASRVEPGEERQRLTMLAEAQVLALDAAIPLLHERVVQGEAKGVSGVDRDPRERELIDSDSRAGA